MNGTTVIYGNVHLYNVLTRQWEQTIQYDESNTDVLLHKFTMRFEGVLHTLQLNPWETLGLFPNTPGAQAIQSRYRDAREALGQSRQPLEIYLGNVLLFACYPSNGQPNQSDRDVDNGPKPKDLSIQHIAGSAAFRVSFTVECAKVECRSGGAPPVVLSNRWQILEDMDANGFTTRTITGRLRMSLPGAIGKNGPYQVAWRSLVVPSLEYGFRRDRMEFSSAKNGLDCDYVVTDRQIHTAAPWPATKMQCSHSESSQNALTFFSELSIRLEGPPHVDKRMLIARALQVVDARLRFIDAKWGQQNATDYTLENAYITDHLGDENAVEVGVRLQRYPRDGEGSLLANLPVDATGKPLALPEYLGHPYSPQVSEPPAYYGYGPTGTENRLGVLAVLQCFLQSPCSTDHAINQPSTPPTIAEETPVYERREGTAPEYTLESQDNSNVKQSAREAIYTTAAMQSSYTADDLVVILPLAAAVASAGADTCRAIQLGSGRCLRMITFDAERVGGWPSIPQPLAFYEDGNLRARRLKYVLNPQPPTLDAGKRQYIYRVSGVYTYALNRPPTAQEKLRTGALPFTKYTVNDTGFDQSLAYDASRGP